MSRTTPRNARSLVLSLTLAAALPLALAGCSSGAPGPASQSCVPACASVACGSQDGCGGTCAAGSGCAVAAGPVTVEGGVTHGAASGAGPAHRIQGALTHGAAPRTLQSAAYRIEQGTLR